MELGSLCPGSRHYILAIDAHTLHDLQLPLAILQQSEWGAIDDSSEARKLAFDAGHEIVHKADGENRSCAIGDRAILPDRAQDNDAANQEYDDKLKECQLPAWPPAKQADDDKQEKISENRVDDGGHVQASGNDDDFRVHLLCTYDAESEVINALDRRAAGQDLRWLAVW